MKSSFLTLAILTFSAMVVAQTTPIDFEDGGNGADWTWSVFENGTNLPLEVIDNPDASGGNTSAKVAKITVVPEGATFAGTITSNITPFKFDATNSIVKIMVWKSVISDVGLKFETASAASRGEIKVANTKVNEWEELTFDFSTQENFDDDFTGLVVFPDFDARTDTNVIYFDNITFGDGSGESETVDITFTVNTATFFDTVSTNYNVFLNGAMKGPGFETVEDRPTFVNGETLGWDTDATAVMEHIGGDYWQATYSMFKGDTLLFKYRVQRPDGSSDDDRGFDTAPNPAGWDTRGLVAMQDTVLPVTYFNNVGGSDPNAMEPYTPYDDSVSVFFRVNVSAAVQQNSFDPETDSVSIVGNPEFFRNSGDWSSSRTYYLNREPVPDYATGNENHFYSGAVVVAKDSLANFTNVEYKFVLVRNGSITAWDDRPGGNRVLTVPAQDSTVQWVYFKDEAPAQEELVTANVRFNVNVGILEGLGFFSSGIGDEVVIRGADPIGWGTSEDNVASFDDEDLNWTLTFPLTRAPNTEFKYKYYIQYDDSRKDESSPNYLPSVADPDGGDDFGYEEPVTTGGADRIFEFGSETEQTTGDQLFNGLLSAAIINADDTPNGSLEVTFEIDMAPAMDAGLSQPFNPETDSVYMQLESKYTALTNGFTSGNLFFDDADSPADYEFLRFEETDEQDIYALTLNLQFPTLNDFGFVIRYGQPSDSQTDMVTNGGGTDPGRRYYQFITPDEVTFLGRDPFIGDVYEVAWPGTHTMQRLTWKEEDLPFDVQPDYAALASSTEDELSRPGEFRLNQNYPNPFNPSTNISFSMPNAANVTLKVYNVLGQEVATLLSNKALNSGAHSVAFDASALSSGMYIYRIEAGSFVSTKRMMLIK